jgi:hypothetical protein
MSSALMEAPTALFATAAAGGRRPTLEELLESRWRAVNAAGQADCPVCHATMHLEGEQARCGGCGTTLS